jgi:hypothetical protein
MVPVVPLAHDKLPGHAPAVTGAGAAGWNFVKGVFLALDFRKNGEQNSCILSVNELGDGYLDPQLFGRYDRTDDCRGQLMSGKIIFFFQSVRAPGLVPGNGRCAGSPEDAQRIDGVVREALP